MYCGWPPRGRYTLLQSVSPHVLRISECESFFSFFLFFCVTPRMLAAQAPPPFVAQTCLSSARSQMKSESLPFRPHSATSCPATSVHWVSACFGFFKFLLSLSSYVGDNASTWAHSLISSFVGYLSFSLFLSSFRYFFCNVYILLCMFVHLCRSFRSFFSPILPLLLCTHYSSSSPP